MAIVWINNLENRFFSKSIDLERTMRGITGLFFATKKLGLTSTVYFGCFVKLDVASLVVLLYIFIFLKQLSVVLEFGMSLNCSIKEAYLLQYCLLMRNSRL